MSASETASAINAHLDGSIDHLAQARVGVESLLSQALAADSARATAEAQANHLTEQMVALQDELAAAYERIRFLEGGSDPVIRPVFIGACPTIEPVQGTAVSTVEKWGGPILAALRQFRDDATPWAARPECALWHPSWKVDPAVEITERWVIDRVGVCDPHDIVTINHEQDVKARSGGWTAAMADPYVAQMNAFHAMVDRLRDRGDIAPVETGWVGAGWTWDAATPGNLYDPLRGRPQYPGDPTNPRFAAYWMERIEDDLICVDLDAYANPTRYPNFTPVIAAVVAAVDTYGFAGWSVAEFIHPRIRTGDSWLDPVADTNGSQRAAWLTQTIETCMAQAHRPRAIHLFDTDWLRTNRTRQVIDVGSNEYAAVRSLQTALQAY